MPLCNMKEYIILKVGSFRQVVLDVKRCPFLFKTLLVGPAAVGSDDGGLSLDTPSLETEIRRLAVAALKRENTRDIVASMSKLLIQDQKTVQIYISNYC